MSVTTCYANPRDEEGKSREGECTGKTLSNGDWAVCVVSARTAWRDSVEDNVCALAGGFWKLNAQKRELPSFVMSPMISTWICIAFTTIVRDDQ